MTQRKGQGMWVQPFILIVFAIVVILTIVLLIFAVARSEPVDPTTDKDLLYYRAHNVLIGLLRQPVEGVDISRDGEPDPITLGQLLIENRKTRNHDELLDDLICDRMPDGTYYLLFVRYLGNPHHYVSAPSGAYDFEGTSSKDRNTYTTFNAPAVIEASHAVEVRMQLPDSEGDILLQFHYTDETAETKRTSVHAELSEEHPIECFRRNTP